LLFLVSSPSPAALGQAPGSQDATADPRAFDIIKTYRTAPGTGVLVFTLFAERNGTHLDRQAVLKLENVSNHSIAVAVTDDVGKGVFTDVPLGSYQLDASAVGYLTQHRDMNVIDPQRPIETQLILKRDPYAVNLDVAASIMSPKARKQAKHAISALKSGNLTAAEKHLDEAYQLSPSSPDVNFLLGYLYFAKKDFDQAGSFLGTATTLNPANGQALTLLGRAHLERRDYPAARSALEQAVLADSDSWLSHDLLADTYLRQKDYGKARDEAQVAIRKGKASASPAELILGQALLGLGQDQESLQAFNTFLEHAPKNPQADQVRTLIREINEHKPTRSATSASPDGGGITLAGVDSLAALEAPALPIKPWAPPGIDEIKPLVASGAECPTRTVVEESGKRVRELVDDVSRFAAVEDLFHQSLDRYGIPVRTETRKYDYIATISESSAASVSIDEYRSDKLIERSFPDHIVSTGFITLALVFHPDMREDFDLRCEGLGDWHGEPSWLVHFQQRSDRPNRMHSYKVGDQLFPVDLKGRAWITADKFQIIRIEADIVKPIPSIQLLSEHQMVEYGPIPFPRKNTSLWLPKTAEIYFDFRKHHYYRRHSFDHYLLFSVETEERRNEPVPKKN
jgi:tetratricopeptide (TPR) repeat protein